MPLYGGHRVERFGVMLLDTRRRLIRSDDSVDRLARRRAWSHPREVFREAMLALGGGVVVFHNHPSGDPTPSATIGW